MTRRVALYLGNAVASGVVGWAVLMLGFEGAYWASAYAKHCRRKWRG